MKWDEMVGIAACGFLAGSNPKAEWEPLSEATKLLWRNAAESALRRLLAAGLTIVPREATREMLDAAGDEYVPWADAVRCWSAALAAGEIKPEDRP